MLKSDYGRSLELICPTCAGSQFKFDESVAEEEREYTCDTCEGVFSREAILESNAERIEGTVDEMKQEIIKDVQKAFKDAFKGWKR